MQQKIQKVQDHYNRLVELQQSLEKSIADWQESVVLMKKLEDFYFTPSWIELYSATETFNIDTKGNYSVLSEDAVWNVLERLREIAEELQQSISPILENET